MRAAGYHFKTAAGARSKASKLLRNVRPEATLDPAVAALDTIRRAIWGALKPATREGLNADTRERDGVPLPEQLSTPWLFSDREFEEGKPPLDCPKEPWDALSRKQELAAKGEAPRRPDEPNRN